MAEKDPIGVRIYNFIHGKDFPFQPGTTEPRPDAQRRHDRDISNRPAPTPESVRDRVQTIGQKRAADTEGAEAAALRDADPSTAHKTNYATGGPVVVKPPMYATGGLVPRPGMPLQPGMPYSVGAPAAQPTVPGGNPVPLPFNPNAVRGEADGGPIVGPGTGTSDSILARVSNGEYVIPAAVVAKVGVPVIDRMVQGLATSTPEQVSQILNPWMDLFDEEDGAGKSIVTEPMPSHPKAQARADAEKKQSSAETTVEKEHGITLGGGEGSTGSPIPREPAKDAPKPVPTTSAPHPKPHPPTKQSAPAAARKGSIANAAPQRLKY